MAQAIPTSMVGLKGHKGKGQKWKKVDTNVGDYSIGAHDGSMLEQMFPSTRWFWLQVFPGNNNVTHMM
jgi:hypothetical protein